MGHDLVGLKKKSRSGGALPEEVSSREARPGQEPSKLRRHKGGEDLSLPVSASHLRRK
jgi:hypothetical protein